MNEHTLKTDFSAGFTVLDEVIAHSNFIKLYFGDEQDRSILETALIRAQEFSGDPNGILQKMKPTAADVSGREIPASIKEALSVFVSIQGASEAFRFVANEVFKERLDKVVKTDENTPNNELRKAVRELRIAILLRNFAVANAQTVMEMNPMELTNKKPRAIGQANATTVDLKLAQN